MGWSDFGMLEKGTREVQGLLGVVSTWLLMGGCVIYLTGVYKWVLRAWGELESLGRPVSISIHLNHS
jgi:hypothetical protein